MNLSEIKLEDLKEEIKRRENREEIDKIKKNLQDKWGNPRNIWKVSTAGDCEGRTTRFIGYFEGHLADVYAQCYNQMVYSFYLESVIPPKIEKVSAPKHSEKDKMVIGYNALGWAGNHKEHEAYVNSVAFAEWLQKESPEFVKLIPENRHFRMEVK